VTAARPRRPAGGLANGEGRAAAVGAAFRTACGQVIVSEAALLFEIAIPRRQVRRKLSHGPRRARQRSARLPRGHAVASLPHREAP
jgi:hypothetical protein